MIAKKVLTLPIYSRQGTYYLHTRLGGRQFKRTLKTRDPALAKLRALEFLRVIEMTKPKLSDFDFSGGIKKFELDISKGVARSDGPEDHARLMEAIRYVAPLYQATPPPPAPGGARSLSHQGSSLRLLGVLDKMLGLKKNLAIATVTSYKNTVGEFSKFLKNPEIQSVGVSDVTRYQEFLSMNKNGLRTIDNKIATLRLFFNFAKKQGYFFEENPAANRNLLSKKDKMKSGFSIFTLEEIKAILSSEFLKEQKTKSPDYFWVLVLGLVSGCRIGEITSLTKKQITVGEHFFTLKITDSKTLAGIREIPIPIELMKIGFEDFLKTQQSAVFKYMPRPGKGSGNAVGKMFKRNLEAEKITDSKLVFHSLRKFANDYFQKSGVEYEPRCQFFGHEIDSVNVNFYTNGYTPEQLFEGTKKPQTELIKLI